MMLEQIKKQNDIKKISKNDYHTLASEIRDFLIQKISITGGHLGSNLGTVELTMALHLSLNFPEDKLIWDVGHQSYTHKILTGRRSGFDELRKMGGMSGFPKRSESECDCFDTGHSSTSISAGLGLVMAREIHKKDYTVVSVIGDGSLTGGMAYEALNNASRINTNYIIVLNDNNMSISENVGGISSYLNGLRTADKYLDLKEGIYNTLKGMPKYGESMVESIRKAKSSFKQLVIPGMFFEDMGITYLGPVDGHDIDAMIKVFHEAKRRKNPVLVHVLTQKGKGYAPAERHPARFHGAEPFCIENGVPLKIKKKASYTDVFSTVMLKLADRNEKIVAITAAMPDGTGLKRFRSQFPERFFDVGIAEEHAVTFAAGLAVGGLVPVVAIYSTFLQRAYDQILHDVCIQDLPVIFAIDRAGLVGSDGETHQGIFDLSFLSSIPNITILAPKNKWELSDMLKFAVDFAHPIAIRYPRGEAYAGLEEHRKEILFSKSEVIFEEENILIMAVGSMVKTAEEIHDNLSKLNIRSTIVNARFVKPFDKEMILKFSKDHDLLVTMEENVTNGGFGEHVSTFLMEEDIKLDQINISIRDTFVEHGNPELLKQAQGLDAGSVTEKIIEWLKHKGK